MSLEGAAALVTGASSGIGEATARAFAAQGAAVALLARRGDRLDKLAGEIELASGKAVKLEADVSDRAQAEAAVAEAAEELGRLDVVVNNAGVMLLGPIENAPTDEWRRMIHVNVFGVLYCTHAALPLMLAQ
ncbi:MAG TPA: SDR family NAD(P)-dependent oxidoreductase, partial [Solirubrobacterales bacterium]|nr:SDR family NAD(P)-dependent oxidoreductase [Solirubrobacterales bacterium]